MDFTPTAEQLAILSHARETRDNLLIVARAGAAKTTTIVLLANALSDLSILCLAFNTKIAKELTERLPPSAKARTMNSVGNEMWRNFLGKWPKLNDRKVSDILRGIISTAPRDDRDALNDNFPELLAAIRRAKALGYLPNPPAAARPLLDADTFYSELELELSPTERAVIDETLSESFRRACAGEIDFADQIYCPAITSAACPFYDLVMVDEAQDLSPADQALLGKFSRRSRVIAVGDDCQAIYEFRGASSESLNLLAAAFNMSRLYLTICFRSAESIVRNAQWRAPDMQWRPGAPQGEVRTLETWSAADLLPGDAIICRNNAPLFRAAIRLIRAGLYPELSSGDIVASLSRVMKKLGKPTTTAEEALVALADWKEAELKRVRSPFRINDTAECIQVILESRPTLGAAISFLDDLLSRSGSIRLMTGHKSKGLEFDRVFFLDRFLCTKKGQDSNIRYVIETRARQSLFYVTSEGWNMALSPGKKTISQPDQRA